VSYSLRKVQKAASCLAPGEFSIAAVETSLGQSQLAVGRQDRLRAQDQKTLAKGAAGAPLHPTISETEKGEKNPSWFMESVKSLVSSEQPHSSIEIAWKSYLTQAPLY